VIDRIYRFIRESLSIKFKRKDLRPGSISFIQRCGSLLNLNLHFHLLVTDGAFICRKNKPVFFHKISDPCDHDIAELLESIIEAVELYLHKRGMLDAEDESEIPEDLMSIEAASRASVAQKIAFGERRGQRVSWARLLKRVFAIDVSRCPRCKSDLEIIAAVLDPKQIARYLKHTGMPAAPPARVGVKMRVANDEWC
jgi:hypothetical protein